MTETDAWFDALAGAEESVSAELLAIRRAANRQASHEVDELAWRRLHGRLQREGLLPRRRPAWQQSLARAAVVVLCVGLVLEIARSPQLDQSEPVPQAVAPQEQARDQAVAPERREEAMADSASGQRKSEGLRREESRQAFSALQSKRAMATPLLRIESGNIERVVAALRSLAQERPGVTLQDADPAAWTLRCAQRDDCEALNAVLAPYTDQRLAAGEEWRLPMPRADQ